MSIDAKSAPDTAPAPRRRPRLADYDTYLILIGFLVLAAISSPAFLTLGNIGNLLSQSALLGMLAVAQFIVVVSGGFDLSVAAVMALASVVFAKLIWLGPLPAAAVAILAGGACGLFNGIAITKGRVQPLLATLAMMGIGRGLALSISEKSILVNDPAITAMRGLVGPISVPTMVWIVVMIVSALWYAQSRLALHIQAVGGNETTARLAGIAVDRVKIGVYVASGLLAGLTGVVLVIRSSSGVPLGGAGWELDTIAAIVIGGVNLFGGEGRLLRAMAGVLIYQMIANIMNLSGIDPFYQDIVRAAVIIAAVGLSILRQRQAGKRIIQGRSK